MTVRLPPGRRTGYGAGDDAGDVAIYLGKKAFFNVE